MKKLLLFSFLFSFSICNAQFWSENFTVAGCSNGNPASGYVSPNGTWTVTGTGINDTYADIWFVSARGNNTGVGNCADVCNATANNSTLHIGNAALPVPPTPVGPDSAVTYLTGVFCGFGYCSTTHKRVESPTINCSGRSGISISFIYLEGGEGSDDDATLVYSPDGITWSQIDALAKTTVCGGSSGIWTAFTTTLPASADNNPTVKIGFNWTNDNDATGTDPSFAVDNVALTGAVGINDVNMPEECSAYCDGSNIVVRSNGTSKVLSVMNMIGESVPFTSSGNVIQLKENTEGIYFLRIETGKQVVTRKVQMLR